MQTIITKFIPATNTRCSRIKARTTSGISITVSWQHELNVNDNHVHVAKMLAKRLGWYGRWYSGPGDKGGQVFVCIRQQDPDFIVNDETEEE